MKPEIQARLEELGKYNFEESELEWADRHVPEARKYIENTYSALIRAQYHLEDMQEARRQMEKYEKAWRRLWQLMAEEHVKDRDFADVDMRYYRHLPDGNYFDMSSDDLGGRVRVFPRKPKNPPKDMRWTTADKMIDMHYHPIIFNFVKTFGAWFEEDEPYRPNKDSQREDIERCKAKVAAGKGLKFKRHRKGFDEYE